jgi:uncharacterized protein YukE
MGELIAIVAILCVFGIPIIAILSEHKRKMAEMGMGQGGANATVLNELKDMKRQIEELRDTTTRYDISFDSALQRMESRMNHMEQKVSTIENEVHTTQGQAR